jgi:hypothetical protein
VPALQKHWPLLKVLSPRNRKRCQAQYNAEKLLTRLIINVTSMSPRRRNVTMTIGYLSQAASRREQSDMRFWRLRYWNQKRQPLLGNGTLNTCLWQWILTQQELLEAWKQCFLCVHYQGYITTPYRNLVESWENCKPAIIQWGHEHKISTSTASSRNLAIPSKDCNQAQLGQTTTDCVCVLQWVVKCIN